MKNKWMPKEGLTVEKNSFGRSLTFDATVLHHKLDNYIMQTMLSFWLYPDIFTMAVVTYVISDKFK